MKLSIIIPVYNAEKYLYKCLQSIVLQGLKNDSFEVVLVNDGSTDQSLKIAESFVGKIKNITIFTQPNQGEAVSRNNALKVSHGEYITFLDSDDYYENNALASALDIMSLSNLDILYLRLQQVDEWGKFMDFVFDLENEGVVSAGIKYGRRAFPATVYRKKIIGDITFPIGVLVGPDSVFNAMVQSRAQRVSFTRIAVYNYTFRADSLSKQGYTNKAFRGFLRAIGEVRSFQQVHFKNSGEATAYFDEIFEVFVTRILELSIMPEWQSKRYNELRDLLKKEDLYYILETFHAKYPYVDSSYLLFKNYQKYVALKSRIYKLIYRA